MYEIKDTGMGVTLPKSVFYRNNFIRDSTALLYNLRRLSQIFDEGLRREAEKNTSLLGKK